MQKKFTEPVFSIEPKCEILGSIKNTGCVNLFCISGSDLIFNQKAMILENVRLNFSAGDNF